jgi:hypothetical protein
MKESVNKLSPNSKLLRPSGIFAFMSIFAFLAVVMIIVF